MKTTWAIAGIGLLLGSAAIALAGPNIPRTIGAGPPPVEEYTTMVFAPPARRAAGSPVARPGYYITLETPGVPVTESLNVVVTSNMYGYVSAALTGFSTPGLVVTTLPGTVPYARGVTVIPIPVTAVASMAVTPDEYTGTITITATSTGCERPPWQ